MIRFSLFLCAGLIAAPSFASRPCNTTINRSCFKLINQASQAAEIKCGSFPKVSALANASGSTQLSLAWGDGLGAPDPRQLNCKVSYTNGTSKSFAFYNSYWGSNIDFTLSSTNHLNIHIADGWSTRTSDFSINW